MVEHHVLGAFADEDGVRPFLPGLAPETDVAHEDILPPDEHRFILGWRTLGHQQRLGARIVNYADDFVICCRGTAEEAMRVMQAMMNRLKLTVNETKTRLCRVPDESFDFLGYPC